MIKEHVFVVRIWREHREIEGEAPRLRGMIQHAVTGEKQYFNDIGNVSEFLATHLNLSQTSKTKPQFRTKIWEENLSQVPTHLPEEPGVKDGSL